MTPYYYWHVRLISDEGEYCSHVGWVVRATTPESAIQQTSMLGIDNGPNGEFSKYPQLTVDVLEFTSNGIAQLY